MADKIQEDEVTVQDKGTKNTGSAVNINWKEIAIISTCAAFALAFLALFFNMIGVYSTALFVTLVTIAFALVVFSTVLAFIDFHKEGKVSFNVDLVLNLVAIVVVILVACFGSLASVVSLFGPG